MKRKIGATVALLLALLLLLGGCKRSEISGNLGTVLDDWRTGPTPKAPDPIEIKPYTDASFGEDLGFEVVSLPPEDVMTAVKFFVIDGWYGQVEFEAADDTGYNVRMAKIGGAKLSTTFLETHALNPQTLDVGGIEAETRASLVGCTLTVWTRGDVQYAMHSNKVQGAPAEETIAAMVAGLDCALMEDYATPAE